MYKNRANRPVKDFPRTQGTKYYHGIGEELNNHEPRVGISKWKRRRKCHCRDVCGGHKRNAIADKEKHWTKWNWD